MHVNHAFTTILQSINDWPTEVLPLAKAATSLGVGIQTLKRQATRGTFKIVSTDQGRPGVSKDDMRLLAERNRGRLLGWTRLVDVCKELGIHRNIGESVCKAAGDPPLLDLCGHHRISPENERQLRQRMIEWQSRANWVRKVDFAQEVNEDPRLIDVVVRKLHKAVDRDPQGFTILSPEACQAFRDWRARRDAKRRPVYQHEGQPYHAVDAVAAEAAALMTLPGTPAWRQLSDRYYRRVLFWISIGSLKARHFLGKHYLAEPERQAILDDLPLTEASRCAGVAVSTIKDWVAKGKLQAHHRLGNRRSILRRQFLAFVRRQYQQSPKLRQRETVPLWLLGPLQEHAETLGLRSMESLGTALCNEGPFPSDLKETIAHGEGKVPTKAWHLLNDWLNAIAQGTLPKALNHYQAIPASRVLAKIDELAARDQFPDRETLLDCCATLDRTDRVRFLNKLQESAMVFTGAIPIFLARARRSQSLKLYRPQERFAIGDMVMHLEAYDFGIVAAISDQGTMTVDWQGSGPLVMRYRQPA